MRWFRRREPAGPEAGPWLVTLRIGWWRAPFVLPALEPWPVLDRRPRWCTEYDLDYPELDIDLLVYATTEAHAADSVGRVAGRVCALAGEEVKSVTAVPA